MKYNRGENFFLRDTIKKTAERLTFIEPSLPNDNRSGNQNN